MVDNQSPPGLGQANFRLWWLRFRVSVRPDDRPEGLRCWLDGRNAFSFEKWGPSKRSLDREGEVYEKIGTHSSILQYFGVVEVEPGVHSLHLELASEGNLRSFIRANHPDSIPISQRLAWIIDLGTGLKYIHSKGVIHCDFSCRNVFLTEDHKVKIGDFGGAKLDEKDPYDAEEPWYEFPLRGRSWEERSYIKRELFALGCATYEVMAWKRPFGDLDPVEVEKRYAQEEFPEVQAVPSVDVIRKCWSEEFESATGVVIALQAAAS